MSYIPQKLNIGGHEVLVRVGEKDELLNRVNAWGEYNPEKWTIDIQGNLSNTFKLQILAHEIVHAFFNTGPQSELKPEEQEKICQLFENQFFRFLAENDLSFFRPGPAPAPAPGGPAANDQQLPPKT